MCPKIAQSTMTHTQGFTTSLEITIVIQESQITMVTDRKECPKKNMKGNISSLYLKRRRVMRR